ncbi:MAG: RluA family pseudouridine synthase [Planctomycetota bacterium]|nr:RluA family pseudouridine synthase [Planctomycetota bacterium]
MHGIRLQDYLGRVLPKVHRASLRGLVDLGEVLVNGQQARRNVRLLANDFVELPAAADLPRRRPQAPVTPSVLGEGAAYLVLGKPAGLPTVPDRSGRMDSVHGQLEALRVGQDLRIVHRLDRDTSGCLLLAKGLEAARHFDRQWRSDRVAKEYVALVHGRVARDEQTIDLFLGPDRRRPGKVVASEREQRGFRAASTEVQVMQRFVNFTLLRLRPATGRGHQLRVHLRAIGHPIVADSDYRGEPLFLSKIKSGYKQRFGASEKPLLGRMFLHAEVLAFEDPDGERVTVEAPLPKDLQLALAKLSKFAAED